MKHFWIFLFLPAIVFAQHEEMPANLKIAGHRGGFYFEYPESSFALFEFIAQQFSPDTIILEIDLRKSKDGTIFLMHDPFVDRTTNGNGKLDELKDSHIKSLYLKNETGQLTHERIPGFEQMLNYIKGKNINLMLDIKAPIHAEVYEMVKKHHLENRMITLTFRMEQTRAAASLSNVISLSALIESESDWQKFSEISMAPEKKLAYVNDKTPPGLIRDMKQKKIRVMADVSEAIRNSGTPLSKAGYQRKVIEGSLDILITDFPIEAMKALWKTE